MKLPYDLHIHSCLSPCADDDMTPGNIAGMAYLQGLKIVALTDHNSAKNCRSFFSVARKLGIVPIAGMELTTAEDIHVVCLLPTLEAALELDRIVSESLIPVKNKPAIFGRQILTDENDEPCGELPNLLINATRLDLASAYETVRNLGGVCYPAHVDRDSGGIIAMLGDIPEDVPYTSFEIRDFSKLEAYKERYPRLREMKNVVSSDSHNLYSIPEAENLIELDADIEDEDSVRRALIRYLRGEG